MRDTGWLNRSPCRGVTSHQGCVTADDRAVTVSRHVLSRPMTAPLADAGALPRAVAVTHSIAPERRGSEPRLVSDTTTGTPGLSIGATSRAAVAWYSTPAARSIARSTRPTAAHTDVSASSA